MSKEFKEEIEKDEITFINSLHHEVELFLNSTGNKERFHEEKALLNDRTIEILKVLGYDLGTNKESKENMKLIAKYEDFGKIMKETKPSCGNCKTPKEYSERFGLWSEIYTKMIMLFFKDSTKFEKDKLDDYVWNKK